MKLQKNTYLNQKSKGNKMETITIKIDMNKVKWEHQYKEEMIKSLARTLELVKNTKYEGSNDYMDIDRISTEVPASEKSKISHVREIILELENTLGKLIPLDDIYREAGDRNISKEDVEEAIYKMKRTGDLFTAKDGFISRI